MSFTDQELQEFKTEALELLEVAETSLLALDEGADFKALFDRVFRSFHNLKGASGMMELLELQAHTHELENILMGFKAKDGIPKHYVSLFLRGIDAARHLLDGKSIKFDFSVEAVPVEPAVGEFAMGEFFSECEEMIERVSIGLQSLEQGTSSKDLIDGVYRDIHSLKGAAFLFSAQNIGNIGHAMESSLERVRNGTHQATVKLVSVLFSGIKFIEQEVVALKTGVHEAGTVDRIASFIQQLNDVSLNLPEVKPMSQEPVAGSDVQNISEATEAPDASKGASIRVPVALLDNLMTLMGEMVLVRNQVLQYSSRSEDLEFLNLSKRLNGVTSEIQEEMMKTRMQPIGNVLTKFSRIVRDLSQELKKSIHLTLSGIETELDKSLLEAVKDPLTHIVRNSCDHGIETPEKRRAAGKPESGSVSIRAFHEGGQVVIEVSDDGKGLHKEALIKKAIEKNVITQAQALQMTEKEIYALIFAPGFSTAETVTNVSGRGVGMDVVRTNIEKIGGTVELASAEGKGTSIKIKIPLTLAIVPALIVHSGKNVFAIPQVNLVELVRVDQSATENRIEYLQGSPVYRLRGHLLPLVSLKSILGLKTENDENRTTANIAVLNADHCTFGLIVDDVQDTADIVVKPINRLLKSLHVYSGATIMGDGSVALIVDVLGISKVAQLGKEKELRKNSKEATLKGVAAAQNEHSSQDYLLVRVNSPTKHAIVLGYVHRLEEFKQSQIEFAGTQRVVRYRNVILPLISASERLGYGAPSQKNDPETVVSVVVIQKAGGNFGIEVEDILDTLSSSVELDTSVGKHSCTFGHLNTAEELVVVMDPFELISPQSVEQNVAIHEPTRIDFKKGSALKVLIAEDTLFFQRLLLLLLKKAGHEVTIASDGQEALDLINQTQGQFDLIISDIEMPKMTGFDLARSIRKIPRYATTPLMAVSSRADEKYQAEGLSAGFDLYLEKLKPDSFLSAIHQLCHTQRKAS